MEQDLPKGHVDALRAQLEHVGARIEREGQLEARYALNFIVTRFDTLFAHVNLGVHLTLDRDDLEGLEKFSQAIKRGIVFKALYIEMHPDAAEEGGPLVAMAACMSYLFDRRYSQVRSLGLKIAEDCSFNFFDLEESIDRLTRSSYDEDLHIGDEMEGRIIAYFTDKGFGFIQTEDDRKFFFHIANIVDDDLRARLPGYVPGEVIPVDFQYGGNDGKKYPKAINVALPYEDLD